MVSLGSIKDLIAGLLFIGFGLAFGYASTTYAIGTALRMGPGYFPLMLSGILVVLGTIILVQSFVDGPDETPLEGAPWLGLVLLVGALIFFGATVKGLGIAPALFITTFMSAFASKRTGFLGAVTIAVLIVALCMLIFVFGLGLPLAMVGPWLQF